MFSHLCYQQIVSMHFIKRLPKFSMVMLKQIMYYLISIEQKCKCITCASYEEMEESKVCLEKDK